MSRRVESKDAEAILRLQTWYLNPENYQRLFNAGAFEDDLPAQEPDDIPVEDIDEIDRYFEHLDETRMMTGADILALADDENWV